MESPMFAIKTLSFKLILLVMLSSTVLLSACQEVKKADENTAKPLAKKLENLLAKELENSSVKESTQQGKAVVYQVLTRLFGNKNSTNKAWGTAQENGVGKFNGFTDKALAAIKNKGVTHIWYTGILHHALVADYSQYGISTDDADVIKGRAGSPYAIKDYYNVNPDLAIDVNNRLAEFEALIARTHQHGMKVIIDIVPNHVARDYHSINKPAGVKDFGEQDNTQVEYARDNNFYYVVGEDFKVPKSVDGYQPLGGHSDVSIDGKFDESPAKWTGNGSRKAQPDANDWYETVKINYGVKPDGSYDFPELPENYKDLNYQQHYEFWQNQSVPDSWLKFKEITQFWLSKGVDGFRYDVAEMVPVEFWSYLNSAIKTTNPQALTIAEVYNPAMYRDFIYLGKMDYLYDKVDFYDTLKGIMQGKLASSELIKAQAKVLDIEQYMIHFLENHDEQRIASPEFVGDATIAKPAMVVSTLISRAPTMLYFGQDVGEKGALDAGFGKASRTSIFDYVGVPAHQRWMNDGAFDGGKSTKSEQALTSFYSHLMSLSTLPSISAGKYAALEIEATDVDSKSLLAFARWVDNEQVIVVNQFASKSADFSIIISADIINKWQLKDGNYKLTDFLSQGEPARTANLEVVAGVGLVKLTISELESFVFKIN